MGRCVDVVCIFFQTLPSEPIISCSVAGAETVRDDVVEFIYFFTDRLQTATTLSWFILAMIAFPDKQIKCQEELDAVVGRLRMPTFADRDNLPYLRAAVREALRWRPAAPVGEC